MRTNRPANEPEATSQDTSSEAEPNGGLAKRKILRRVVIFLNCLVLYVLSIGPMFWMWYEAENIGTTPFLRIVYAPLRALCYYKPVENWMNNYINWWIT